MSPHQQTHAQAHACWWFCQQQGEDRLDGFWSESPLQRSDNHACSGSCMRKLLSFHQEISCWGGWVTKQWKWKTMQTPREANPFGWVEACPEDFTCTCLQVWQESRAVRLEENPGPKTFRVGLCTRSPHACARNARCTTCPSIVPSAINPFPHVKHLVLFSISVIQIPKTYENLIFARLCVFRHSAFIQTNFPFEKSCVELMEIVLYLWAPE